MATLRFSEEDSFSALCLTAVIDLREGPSDHHGGDVGLKAANTGPSHVAGSVV
jgi:hypothetical protein